MAGWNRIGAANWRGEEGALVADPGVGFLVSERDYRDFELRAGFFVESATSSGVWIRGTDPAMVALTNPCEVNIWDKRPDPRFATGAIVDLAPADPMPRAGG
jgi:hypothetical protein